MLYTDEEERNYPKIDIKDLKNSMGVCPHCKEQELEYCEILKDESNYEKGIIFNMINSRNRKIRFSILSLFLSKIIFAMAPPIESPHNANTFSP